ncbi:zinc ribbon domain-containing protein [Okeania sp. SIO1I7]|nr:transposase [Okeania sp. SIO1I7]
MCVSKCSQCGFETDRDFNAAINLKKLCVSVA